MSLNNRLRKFSIIALILLLSLNFAALSTRGQERPKVFVVPKDNVFSTETTFVGDTFSINISTSGWESPGLYSYELKLFFDPELLTVIEAVYPPGHFLPPPNFEVPIEINAEAGYVLFGVTKLGDVPGSTGSGVLATVTFEIAKAPPTARSVSCDLTIGDIIFLDPDGNTYTDYDVEHGYYEFAAPRPPLPQLKIDPEYVTAKEIGDLVTVNVTIQDVMEDWKIVGFEWKVRFNTTLLQGLEVVEGDYLASEAAQAAAETGEDYGTYFHAIWEEDYVLSFTLYYRYPWPPEIFPGHYKTGGTLATLTFNVTYKPTFADLVASCDLLLTDVLLVDVDGNEVEYKPLISGRYEIAVAAPPWLSLEPKEYRADELGEEFGLTVFIEELSADWRLVGVEFKIRYNQTMLAVVNVTEAGFIRHFAELAGTETWFQYYLEEDPESGFGIVGILLLPLPNGTWPGPFPSTEDYAAPGDLAMVTFKAIYQHETMELTSDIYLDDIILANSAGKEIPYDRVKTAEEGKCMYTIAMAFKPPPPEKLIDVFTQYEPPYGGQGLGNPSDAFAPQGIVELNAKVTYRGEPVPGKPVTFAIFGAGYQYFVMNFTGDNGIAHWKFTLPAVQEGSIWNVTASVDIAGEVVQDHVYFYVGWLVEVESVTISPTEKTVKIDDKKLPVLYKQQKYDMNVTLKVFTMQDPSKCMQLQGLTPDIVIAYTGVDELGQLIFAKYVVNVTIGEVLPEKLAPGESRQWSNGLVTDVEIPKTAYTGVAKIHINVLTNLPWTNGVPYTDAYEKEVWVMRPEE